MKTKIILIQQHEYKGQSEFEGWRVVSVTPCSCTEVGGACFLVVLETT